MTAIQFVGQVLFEGGRYVVTLPELEGIEPGSAVIVHLESIEVTV